MLENNNKCWKRIKPYRSNKGLNSNKVLLKEKRELVSDEKQLASIIDNFFINITKSLNLIQKHSVYSVYTCKNLEITLGVFAFVFKTFPKTEVLIQITFLYSCFLQYFDL